MNNKKAKIIIAILIFIFLGLIIFAFASPNDEEGENLDNRVKQGEVDKKPSKETENKTDSEDETEKERNTEKEAKAKDDSYDKAKALVETAEKSLTKEDVEAAKKAIGKVTKGTDTKELEDRIAAVESDINAKDLVDALAKLVEEAENTNGIGAAREFNTENEVEAAVEAVNNAELKEELEEALEEILNILNDATAPNVKVPAEPTSQDVTIEVEDDTNVTIKLNGEEVENGTVVTEEGTYTLTVTDEAFNETEVEFTIDKTAPVITGVEEGKVYNEAVKVSVDDATNVNVSLDDKRFDLEDEITDGIHQLVVTDEADNSTVVNFTVDTTAPVVTGVDNNSFVNTDVEVEVDDLTNVTATLDGEEFNLEDAITAEGEHTLVVTDEAGNATTVTFTIDKTAPTVDITDGRIFNCSLTAVITDANFDKATLNGVEYTTNKIGVTAEGKYTLVMYDKAGNTSTIKFSVDKTAPTLNTSAYGVAGKEGLIIYVTNNDTINVTGFISEKLKKAPKMTFTVGDTSYELVAAQLSGANVGNSYMFIASATLEETIDLKNGNLIITISDLVDLAGNKTDSIVIEYKGGEAIIVDRELPVIGVRGTSVGKDGVYSSIDLQFSDNYQVKKIVTNGKEVTRTPDKSMAQLFETYGSLYVEGENTVEIYDAAGNKATFTFTLDTVAPELTLKEDSVGSHDVYTQPNFKLYDNVGIDKVVVNETSEFAQSFGNWGDFNYGDHINYVNGNNTVTLYDRAGNSVTKTVYVDKVAPHFEVKNSSIGDAELNIYKNLDLLLVDDKGVVKVSVNGHDMERSFDQYSDLNHGNAGYVEGENTVVLTDAAGNTATLTFTYNPRLVLITNNDELASAINNQADNQDWLIKEGTYTLSKNTSLVYANQTGWFFPILKNNIKIEGNGNVSISVDEMPENGALASQDMITIVGNNVSIDNVTLGGFQNKLIEVIGDGAKLTNITANPWNEKEAGSIYIGAKGITTTLENITLNKGRVTLSGADSTNTLNMKNVTINYAGGEYEANAFPAFNDHSGATVNATNLTVSMSTAYSGNIIDALNMLPNGTTVNLKANNDEYTKEFNIGNATLNKSLTINGNKEITVVDGYVPELNGVTSFAGTLTINAAGTVLNDIRINGGQNQSLIIAVDNVKVNRGFYITKNVEKQGEGTIRLMAPETTNVAIKDAVLRGGIYIDNYTGSEAALISNISGNHIHMQYTGTDPRVGINIRTTVSVALDFAYAMNNGNDITHLQANAYNVLVQNPALLMLSASIYTAA